MANRRNFTRPQQREIKRKLDKINKRKIKDIKGYNRLLALHMRSLGKSNKEISEVIGFKASYVTELVSKFIHNGLDALQEDKRTSNNRRMSFEQESEFLEQFVEIADAGQIITVDSILRKFEEHTQKESDTTTIYALLKRHGWRKVKPRPRHPEGATAEEIESSKKLTKNTERSYWKKIEGTSETSTSSIKK